MTDISGTILPKSDQLNADSLIGGPLTIKITSVKVLPGDDQPVAIFFEGGEKTPFKPCKTARRVLIHIWGKDSSKYVGRSMTVYRDPSVTWGGAEVGGVRISHMSDIDRDHKLMLTATRGNKKPVTIKPLRPLDSRPQNDAPKFDVPAFAQKVEDAVATATDATTLSAWWDGVTPDRKALAATDQAESTRLRALVTEKIAALSAASDV